MGKARASAGGDIDLPKCTVLGLLALLTSI